MSLRRRLSDLLWPAESDGDEVAGAVDAPVEAPPAAPATGPAPGLGARLKRVGVSEEQRLRTGHRPAAAWAGPQPPPRLRAGMSLKQRLQAVGVPDLDAKELARRQRILDASREAESRVRREAAHARVAATCPVPIHPEPVSLPGDLRLREDEFLVAGGGGSGARNRDLTLTTQRLIYSRGRGCRAQLVIHLADVCDLAFHANDTITVGTPSGRWERLPIAQNSVVASRDRLLALVHHARAQRSALPGGFDELVELRDSGAIDAGEYEARRAHAAGSRGGRRRQVEVSGRPTGRTAAAPADAALPGPAPGSPPAPAQPGGGER